MPKSLPICTCLTKDGSRCGRRVSDGSNPPICHVHRAQQAGKPVGALTEPAPFDAERKLLKIAANDRHPQQLQALKLLRERTECARCAANADADKERSAFFASLNHDDKARLAEVIAALDVIKRDVRARIATQQP